MRTHFSPEEIKEQTLTDLREDYQELEYLIETNLFRLEKFVLEIKKNKNSLFYETKQLTEENALCLKNLYGNFLKGIKHWQKLVSEKSASLESIEKLNREKQKYFDLLRTEQGIFGSLITSTDWQSPSFASSLYPQAGRQTGEIIGTINDYKRDSHLDEQEFESLYLKEYVDVGLKFGINVFMTNSGMAAFTTIFNFLLMEGKIKRKVILGKSSYFQYKQLLIKGLGKSVVQIDELKTETILKTIKEERPSVLFFDSLCNGKGLPLPDLTVIIDYLKKNSLEDVYLIIDNTCLSIMFQPLKMIIGQTRKVHLILFESLMKYFQFGFDRVTGGIIVAYGKDTQNIFEYRKHSGTNITDSSVYATPRPSREMLKKRLLRFQRNAFLLASSLDAYLNQSKRNIIKKIIYPGLTHHPSYPWSQKMEFQGSFFNFEFQDKQANTWQYKRFIKTALSEAKKEKISLIAGTSFGLNTTRIYLTSLWSKYGDPFLRIAVGKETLLEIKNLEKVFIKTIDKFNKFPHNLSSLI